MAVNINTFKVFTEFVSNKVQSGNSVTVSQFNTVAHQAQMLVFERDRQMFVSTGATTDFLELFLKTTTKQVDATTGILPYPDDFEHTSSIRSYYKGNEYPLDMVTNTKWGDSLISSLNKPDLRFPIFTEFAQEYRFAPKNIGTVFIDYFGTPQKPFWAYTVVNNVQVYDPTNSVDFAFTEAYMNAVASIYLQLIGVNIKDNELMAFSNEFTKETVTPI